MNNGNNGNNGNIGNNGSKSNNDEYKVKDEATYSEQITEFRINHPDADDLFNKRDEAIEEYKEALNKNESNEHIRITKKRLDILNGYIERLIIGFFKKLEDEQIKIDDHYQSWADTSSIKVDKETLKQYANSSFNDMACAFASMGIMFASDMVSQTFCVPRGPSTDCNAADITNFQGDCFNKYTGLDQEGKIPHDNTGGYPQHLSWGQKELSQAKCAAGIATVGRQERGVCGLGYYMGESPKDTFNKTRCHLHSDDTDGEEDGAWATMGDLNNTCAIEVGGDEIKGPTWDKNYYKSYGPADLQYGKISKEECATNSDLSTAPTGQRAQCKLGYYEGVAVPENSTQCTQPWDDAFNADDVCRQQVGFGQGTYSMDQPSQHTYGVINEFNTGEHGCMITDKRLQCAMGYSNGVKLDPWSSECVLRTDNIGGVCKNTYGDEWFPWPQTQSSWEQGCALSETKTKATCRKDDMVPIGTEFTNVAYEAGGQQCTTTGTAGLYNKDYACSADYGPNYTFVDYTQDVGVKYGDVTTLQNNNGNTGNSSLSGNQNSTDYTDFTADKDKCTGLMYRGKCKKTRELNDFKNSICLWTNRSCGGKSCKDRCESAGKGWAALNENKNCNSLEGGENPGCICCTVNNYDDNGTIINKTDEYLATDNPYHSAILDTQGIVGLDAHTYDGANGVLKPVGTHDLFICKHGAFLEDRPNEKECVDNLTTDLEKALDDPGKYVYTPVGSDTELMKKHLKTYGNMGDIGPNQMWFRNTSNYAWPNMYGGKTCSDHFDDNVNSCLIKRSDLGIQASQNQDPPSGWNLKDCTKGEYTYDLEANYWYSCDKPE